MIIEKKVEEIIQNPHHYKNLRAPLQHWKRVHIDRSFVLVFSVDETTKTIIFEDYDHHDNIYSKWLLASKLLANKKLISASNPLYI